MGAPVCPYVPLHVQNKIEEDIESGISYLSFDGYGQVSRLDPGGMIRFHSYDTGKARWLPHHAVIRVPER